MLVGIDCFWHGDSLLVIIELFNAWFHTHATLMKDANYRKIGLCVLDKQLFEE